MNGRKKSKINRVYTLPHKSTLSALVEKCLRNNITENDLISIEKQAIFLCSSWESRFFFRSLFKIPSVKRARRSRLLFSFKRNDTNEHVNKHYKSHKRFFIVIGYFMCAFSHSVKLLVIITVHQFSGNGDQMTILLNENQIIATFRLIQSMV